jgi:hypothetical protein
MRGLRTPIINNKQRFRLVNGKSVPLLRIYPTRQISFDILMFWSPRGLCPPPPVP